MSPPFSAPTSLLPFVESFYRDSIRLLRRCVKPDRREFQRVATRVGLSALVAGAIGVFVKLVFIPIRVILLA